MKNIFLLLGVLCVLVSCQNNKNALVFNKEKSIKIDLSSEQIEFPYPDRTQIIKADNGDDVLVATFYTTNFLYFFNLNTGEIVNKIKTDVRTVESFNYISADSIYILYANQNTEGFLDSSNFVRINTKGQILEYHKFNDPNIVYSDDNKTFDESTYYPINRSNYLNISNGTVFFDLVKTDKKQIGTKEFFEHKTPVLAAYNIKDKTFKTCDGIWYTGIKPEVYYPTEYSPFYTSTKDGNPVSRFYYSSTISEWNVNTDEITYHSLQSKLIDSIMPVSRPKTYHTNELDAQYRTLCYDPFRKQYYSTLFFNPNKYGYGAYSMIIADENFNYQGEVFSPPLGTWSPLFTQDYIIGFNTKTRGVLEVDFYTLGYGTKLNDTYISEIKDSLTQRNLEIKNKVSPAGNNNTNSQMSINDFLNAMTVVDSSKYAIATVFLKGGCPACVNFILNVLHDNKRFFNDCPIYFLLISDDKKTMDEYISNFGLDSCKYLVKDEESLITKAVDIEPSNPRFLLVDNSEIVLDTIYLPDNLRNAIPTLFNFFDIEITTQEVKKSSVKQ